MWSYGNGFHNVLYREQSDWATASLKAFIFYSSIEVLGVVLTFHISFHLKNRLVKYAALLLSINLNKTLKFEMKKYKTGTVLAGYRALEIMMKWVVHLEKTSFPLFGWLLCLGNYAISKISCPIFMKVVLSYWIS